MSTFQVQSLKRGALLTLLVWFISTSAFLPLLHTCDPYERVAHGVAGGRIEETHEHDVAGAVDPCDCPACRIGSESGAPARPCALAITCVLDERLAPYSESRPAGFSLAAHLARGPPA